MTTIMIQLQPFFSTIELAMGYLHLVEIQKITREELKSKSGVYGFLCKTNNKLYIGSSINLNVRFSDHTNGTKSNVKLQNAINKYNLQDFIFIVFEYCEPDKLILREQYYIDVLKPEFNILKVAGSLLGYKHNSEILVKMSETRKGRCHSAETKQKMSEARSGENHPLFGKSHTVETRALMSSAKAGDNHPMFGKAHSAEAKARMSSTKGTAINVYDVNGTLINTFSSAREAAKVLNCSKDTILKYAINGNIFKDKWKLSTSPA
jgi:group I intron endonuclease